MTYPTRILPNENFKLIEIDYVLHNSLIRFTKYIENSNDDFELLSKSICDPSKGIFDLSCSLYGVFLTEDNFIKINPEYKEIYCVYCKPNEKVDAPNLEEFFIQEGNSVFINILNLHNKPVKYYDNGTELTAICKVTHTPMKWNFWHFSITWFLERENMYWHELEDPSFKKSWGKSLTHSAKNEASLNASFQESKNKIINANLYTNLKNMNQPE